MELKYRGVSYKTSPADQSAEEPEQMGVYRGVPYRTKSVRASFRQPGEELIYRGVRYTR